MMMFSRQARWVAAAIVAAGAVGISGAFALSSASAGVRAPQPAGLTVKQIALGARLHHTFRPGGTGAAKTEALAAPDDITALRRCRADG
jgi:hypothetical protein